MKFTLLLIILAIITIQQKKSTILLDEFKKAKTLATTWEVCANRHCKFANMTIEEAERLFPLQQLQPDLLNPIEGLQYSEPKDDNINEEKYEDLPTNFDARSIWPNCIHPVRDQQMKCGSCYSHATSESLSDRFCIKSNQKINVVLSVQDTVSCGTLWCNGCDGCLPPYFWFHSTSSGLVTEDCYPYLAVQTECAISKKTCVDPKVTYKKYNAKFSSLKFPYKNINNVKQEIFTNGPVAFHFFVYLDYLSYKGGIYVPTSKTRVGSHLVKCIGWGYDETSKLNYWLIQDSQGTGFGENGFVRFAMGYCGIEDHVTYAEPLIE